MKDSLLVPQRLGFAGLSVLLILMSTTSPLSMDMFSPSIPAMTEYFGVSSSEMTLTVTVFFVFYGVGMLLFGTVSDKLGRKPVLVSCMIAFVAGSALCAMSPNLPVLIGSRAVQALGGGGCSAVAIALLSDVFSPAPRERFLMFMSVVQVIAPVVAPILGAWIVTFSTWRTVFWVLTGFGCLCLAGLALFNETLPRGRRLKTSVLASYSRMGFILRDRAFIVFLLAFVLPNVAFGGYLAVGSYIFIDQFGLSETMYSYFFAATAIVGIFGPIIYTAAVRRLPRKAVLTAMLGLSVLSGVLLLLFGHASPIAFVAAFAPLVLSSSALRPAATSILLQEHEDDAGSASGIINFVIMAVSSVGMFAAAPFDPDFVGSIVVLALVFSAVSLAMWFAFSRSSMSLRGLDSQ